LWVSSKSCGIIALHRIRSISFMPGISEVKIIEVLCHMPKHTK